MRQAINFVFADKSNALSDLKGYRKPCKTLESHTKNVSSKFDVLSELVNLVRGIPWPGYLRFFKSRQEPLQLSEETKKNVKRAFGLDCNSFYNAAIIGAAGTGKSSLINGILGRSDSDKRSAKVSKAGESIQKPQGYRHPDLRRLILWDMPGTGTDTSENKAETYFENFYLQAFDSLIIVVSDRQQIIDSEIAHKAKEFHIPVLFVRTKCDQSIESKISKNQAKYNEKKAIRELVKEVRQRYAQDKLKNKNNLFLLSAESLRSLIRSVNECDYAEKDNHIIDERLTCEEKDMPPYNEKPTCVEREIPLIDEQRFIEALMDKISNKLDQRSNEGTAVR